MIISHIVAMGNDRAIGKDNDLLWHLPNDLRYFKEKTSGHVVVMGRNNWFSIPEKYRPLKDRTNIVLTSADEKDFPGAQVLRSVEDALALAEKEGEKECFIIGGGQLYASTTDIIHRTYITEVKGEFPDADVFYPELNLNDFSEVYRMEHLADERHKYDYHFVMYERK